MSHRFEPSAVASRKLSSRSEDILGYNAGSLADDDLIARCHSFENGTAPVVGLCPPDWNRRL